MSVGLQDALEDTRLNAAVSWALVAFLSLTLVGQLLTVRVLSAAFTAVVVALAVVPPVAYRSPRAMLPWEVLLLASLPVVGRALVAGQTLFGFSLSGRVATYLAVAAVALVVAVELDGFTPVEMNVPFALLFVVVTTMATAGVWAVAQWLSDVYLGTGFLLGRGTPHEVETSLMWDFVAATVVGLFAGVVFELYFRRRVRPLDRVPEDLLGGDEQ